MHVFRDSAEAAFVVFIFAMIPRSMPLTSVKYFFAEILVFTRISNMHIFRDSIDSQVLSCSALC